MSDAIIQVEGLGKKYRLRHQAERQRYVALRDVIADKTKGAAKRLWSAVRRPANPQSAIRSPQSVEDFWALRNVSFSVRQGEVVGIIGRNGAGKSTLLKILSRITEPTEGRVRIKGRVASLLEVGTGFHPELTGRENIFLNGAILGMTREEIKRKFDEIVAFSEVEKFLDTPVKRYSSGMYMRLAFAVAAHLEPEILVVDEVLAVGDASFQKKCLGKMGDVAKQGRTILFVSHNMAGVRSLCPGCIWLNNGSVCATGVTPMITEAYLKSSVQSHESGECNFPEDREKEFQLRRARLLDRDRATTQRFDCDQPITIEFLCQVHHPIRGLYGYLQISRLDGTVVWVSDSYDMGSNPLDELPVGYHFVLLQIPPRTLGPGTYAVYVNFTSSSGIRGFNIDSPGTLFTFQLDDHATRRGNAREGFYSTLLEWKVEAATQHNPYAVSARTPH